MKPLIPYYRVSTKKQGLSGLGLEAQKAAVEALAKSTGRPIIGPAFRLVVPNKEDPANPYVLEGTGYIEVETGKFSRVQLNEAIAHATQSGGTLVVAKLDRLYRNVELTAKLMNGNVDFICCDNPAATKFTMHILAAVAENEAVQISTRTKDALRAYKSRGGKLGSARPGFWQGREQERLDGVRKATKVAAAIRSEQASTRRNLILPRIKALQDAGASLKMVAEQLNAEGRLTPRGKKWTKQKLHELLRSVK